MFFATLMLAIRNLLLHKLRSALTLLGTILGVASVIAMLSIGEGSKLEALEQIRRLGASNVIVRSVKPQPKASTSNNSTNSNNVLAYGLTFADLRVIEDLKLSGCTIVPSVMHTKNLQHNKRHVTGAKVVGTTAAYPLIKPMHLEGRFFNASDVAVSANVVVIARGIAREIFGYEDPIGKSLLVGDDAYRVIGVIGDRDSGSAKTLVENATDDNRLLFVPISSAQNRMGIVQRLVETGSRQYVRIELTEVVLKVDDQSQVRPLASVVRSILAQAHAENKDYEVQVPLELLNQG